VRCLVVLVLATASIANAQVQTVDVFIEAAAYNVTKPGGKPWDPGGSKDAAQAQQLFGIVASAVDISGMTAQIGGALAQVATSGSGAPDPYGIATLEQPGRPGLRQVLEMPQGQKDSFTPIWAGPPGWRNVQLGAGTRIRVQMFERDAFRDDPAGVILITDGDLRAALSAGGHPYPVKGGATSFGVLYLAISVVPSSPPPPVVRQRAKPRFKIPPKAFKGRDPGSVVGTKVLPPR